jgi:toxin ParE1/3/4
MRVRFSEDADADLESIQAFIRRDNPERAVTFARDLALAAIAIGDVPQAYPRLGSAADPDLRRKTHGSYLIIYRVREQVEIVRILHGARDILRVFAGGEA